jgi:hypothetical protein
MVISRLGVGRGATDPLTPEKFSVTKPPEPMEKDHGGGQNPHWVAAPVKKMDPTVFVRLTSE